MNKPEKRPSLSHDVAAFFAKLGIPAKRLSEGDHEVRSPISGAIMRKEKDKWGMT